jgi:ATP-dependent Clp protease ATP-binding subunit ClpB
MTSLKPLLREADNIRIKLSRDEIDPQCVLAAICMPGVGFTNEQLKSFTLTSQEVLDAITSKNDLQGVVGTSGTSSTLQR